MFSIFNSFRSFMRDRSYRALFIATLTIITIGSVFYHYVEGWRLIDSIYFSVITLTTVGYGDLSPQTDFGKIFTICYALTGIGIVFGFINTFYRRGVERFKERQNKN